MRALKSLAPLAALGSILLGCSTDGPTTIELPIAELRITASCPALIVGGRCAIVVEALTAEGQLVVDPILRWSTSDSSIASVDEGGVVEARGPGQATIRVSNSTDTASDQTTISVFGQNPK
ncbi:MAG TPA: Ig-like domain-containing protein [Gemmatimonadota bacterium]|nr:Ig-like domain-containing protein [Gemmatimonadota bacterium]